MSLDQLELLNSTAQVMFLPAGIQAGDREGGARGRNQQTSHGAGNPDVPRNKVAPLVGIEPIKDMERRAELAVLPLLRLVPLRGSPVGFTSEGWFLYCGLVTRRPFIPPCPLLVSRGSALQCMSPVLSIASHTKGFISPVHVLPTPLSRSQRSRVGRVLIRVTGRLAIHGDRMQTRVPRQAFVDGRATA